MCICDFIIKHIKPHRYICLEFDSELIYMNRFLVSINYYRCIRDSNAINLNEWGGRGPSTEFIN